MHRPALVVDLVKPHNLKLYDDPRGPRAARLETAVTHSCNLPETAVGTHFRFGFLLHSSDLWDSFKCSFEGPLGPCWFYLLRLSLYTGWLSERSLSWPLRCRIIGSMNTTFLPAQAY